MSLKSPNPVEVHIGNRIRLARLELYMSQARLAEHLGLTFQQVQKYEKGANRVGGSRLWAISQALKVPPSFFFEGLDDPALDKAGTAAIVRERNAFMATTEGQKLVSRFLAIESDAVRQRMLDLMATLATTDAKPKG